MLEAKIERTTAAQQDTHARESQDRTYDMRGPQPFAREQGREQHDEERPKITDEPGLGRGCEPQGREVQRMVAEQSADPESPHGRWLTQDAQSLRSHGPARDPDEPA